VSDAIVPAKAVRKHVNFSKVTSVVNGTSYRFSLTRDGLVVRKRHSPKTAVLSFEELHRATNLQRQLL